MGISHSKGDGHRGGSVPKGTGNTGESQISCRLLAHPDSGAGGARRSWWPEAKRLHSLTLYKATAFQALGLVQRNPH